MIVLQRHAVQTKFIYLFIYNYAYYHWRHVQLYSTLQNFNSHYCHTNRSKLI